MFHYDLFVSPSKIPHAGNGVFTNEYIPARKVIVYPNEKNITLTKNQFKDIPTNQAQLQSAIRWFDETYTIDPDWSLESNFNHSFAPNCLWYLGFIISLQELEPGDELLIDYRNFLEEGYTLDFKDSITGLEITGFTWPDKMKNGAKLILEHFA